MAEFIKKLYRNQGIRYIFFGGCTTFVNLGSYALLRTVLVVDMTLANVLAEHLRPWDYEVHCVTNFKFVMEDFR